MTAIRNRTSLVSMLFVSLACTQLPALIFRTVRGFGDVGSDPNAPLALWNNMFFGTSYSGGISNRGTVFAPKADGSSFTNLHSFTGPDGATPESGVIISGNTLFGTTFFGGSSQHGAVYRINIDGTGFSNLHSFTAGDPVSWPTTNSDGMYPSGGLVLSGETLFGVTEGGGSLGYGVLFAMDINGAGFTNLHSFSADASQPTSLIISGDTLYGTTSVSSSNYGTVFAIQSDGTEF